MLDIVNANLGANLTYVAIAYDWLNNRMNLTQKQTIVNWFRSLAGDTPQLGSTRGYRFSSTPSSFYPGLAFYGDGVNDSLAQTYVNFIQTYLDDARAISHESGEDGGHAAGLCYSHGSYGVIPPLNFGQSLYALTTATNLTIDQTFNTYPFMNGFPDWFLYGVQPGGKARAPYSDYDTVTLTKFEDCGSHQWNIGKDEYLLAQSLRMMSQVARESGNTAKAQWITWLINTRFQMPKQDTVWDILFNDRFFSAKTPTELGVSKAKAFGWRESEGKIDSYMGNPKAGLGHVYMKSSWDISASTTHAVFKAPPYYYFGHQHFDSLAFSIFKGEPLALPNSGGYFYWYEGTEADTSAGAVAFPHHWYYYERTVSANSLLIMDPNEVIYMRSSSYDSDPEFRDGGQRSMWDTGTLWGSITEGSEYDWGGLIKYEDSGNYTYSSGDATKGYNSIVGGTKYLSRGASPKVSLVQRDFTYLKSADGNSDYFVIFDRIDSTDPTFKKVFLLHTVGEPLLSGSQSTIYGSTSNGLFQSDNATAITLNQGTAKLFMKTLSPSVTKVYKTGGKTMTTLTQAIDDTDGTIFGGPKIDISVASTAEFPAKPVVVIDGKRAATGLATKEAFKCDGKTATKLTGCLRGTRYYKYNPALTHSVGDTVTQFYSWMIREANTGDWIAYPFDYGSPHDEPNISDDSDDYGRWAIRIETVNDETHTNFLNVLHPTTDMSETAMAETVSLVSADNKMQGVLIKDQISPRIVMFAKDNANTQISQLIYNATYASSLTGKHLITSLIPNSVYDVFKDGVKIATHYASGQGVLSFESLGGSTFQILKTGTTTDTTPPAPPKGVRILTTP